MFHCSGAISEQWECEPNMVIAPAIVFFGDFFYTMPPWLVGAIFFALMMAAIEVGLRLGQKSRLMATSHSGL
jgi:hypothetical protein